MKLLRWTVIAINAAAAMLLLGIGAVAWLLGSERGTQWLLTRALTQAQPGISVERIDGTFLDELRFRGIAMELNGDRLAVDELRVAIDVGQILRGALVIVELRSNTVTYERSAGPRADARNALSSLPISIEVQRGAIDRVMISSGQDQVILDRLSFGAVFEANELMVQEIDVTSQGVHMSGRGEIDFGEDIGLSAQIDWQLPREEQSFSGRFVLAGTPQELDISHELLTPYDVTAAGKVWLERTPRVDLVVRWRDVSIPGQDEIHSPSGSVNLSGEVTALNYASSGAISLYGRAMEFDAVGTVNGVLLGFDSLTISSAGGSLTASGEIALDTLQWEMSLAGRGLDPSYYDPAWPGRLDVDAELTGRLQPELRIQAKALSMAGVLRDYPFTTQGSGAFEAPQRWRIDALELIADGDTLTVNGSIDEQLDLTFSGEVHGFERLWPGLSGSVTGAVRVSGTAQRPEISGRIAAREIEFRDYVVGSIDLEGNVAAGADGVVDLSLAAEGLRIRGIDADSLRVNIEGTARDQTVSINVVAEEWQSVLAARGNLQGSLWRGVVESARIDQSELGEWQLLEPAAVEIAADRFVLQSSCLSHAGADLCAQVNIAGRADDEIAASARNFNLQALQPFLPDTVAVRGIYQGAVSYRDPTGNPSARLALTGGPTRLNVALSETQNVASELERVTLGAELTDGKLDLRVDLNGGNSGHLNLRTTMVDVRDRDSAVEGQVDFLWRDLNVLAAFSPDLGSVAGTIGIQVELGGTVTQPSVRGQAQLNEGAVDVPDLGMLIDQINATAVTSDGRTLNYSGTGMVDGRELFVQGSTVLDPGSNWPTRLRINGDSLPLVQLADAEVFVSPDLELDVALPEIAVTGTLHIPSAMIGLDELPAQAQKPSADSVVHGVSEMAPARPLRVRADVLVTLGDDIRYTGSNLTSELSGELRMLYESGRAPNASGVLSIAGSYDAYGQSLRLARGELLFTGPLDNPAIDVRAERKIDQTTVGVQLSGTLKEPLTRIYSDPALSEADALAYLLLGRPLSSTGENETATLESAALAMGLQQALPAVQRLGNSLGLDELSIDTTDVDPGALMAGKYLSPKVYVRYSYGLFNRIGGLLVRFRVNERLSIETRSGDEESMDLIYTVEKD